MTPLRQGEVLLVVSCTALVLLIAFVLGGVFFSRCISCGNGNVKTIELNSATLYGGNLPPAPTCSTTNSAHMTISVNNPGSATTLSNMTITGSSLSTTVNKYYLSGSTCTQLSSSRMPTVPAGAVTNITLFFGASMVSALTANQTYNYVISFANGQSISGSLVAQ